jgi:hypothetical protein
MEGESLIKSDELVSIPQAARMARRSKQAIYRRIERGTLKTYEIQQSAIRVRIGDVLRVQPEFQGLMNHEEPRQQ